MSDKQTEPNDFVEAGEQQRSSLAGEFLLFLKENKKWWLLPIVIVSVLLGVLLIVGQSAAAPFIYTLF